jgi:hypothetical protein
MTLIAALMTTARMTKTEAITMLNMRKLLKS